jgi:hypothetical protein
MDEIELSRKQEKAAQAEALLKNELLQDGFQKLRQEYYSAWQNTNPQDIDQRERLWTAHRMVGLLEKHLKIMVANGKIATKDLAAAKYLKR